MDIVYICRPGDNEELRYSLRSIEKNLQFDNVWIVGGAPSWYSGNLIEVNPVGVKYSVARKNLKTLASSDKISNDFILMNDDFFVMKPMSMPPVWHGGRLEDKVKFRQSKAPNSAYTNLLQETYTILRQHKMRDALDYELHTPLQMTREGLNSVLGYGGLWRSLYGNMNGIGGEEHKDVKVYSSYTPIANVELNIHESIYLSSDDSSFTRLRSVLLDNAFSKPSSFEK